MRDQEPVVIPSHGIMPFTLRPMLPCDRYQHALHLLLTAGLPWAEADRIAREVTA